jgi:hypothetical protein
MCTVAASLLIEAASASLDRGRFTDYEHTFETTGFAER